ncbi:MAG: hypothetical protein GQ542_18900 [Desulforhopalus sp.]|nr:hypothetical protein [Desulforhopalus sp.]
MKNSKWLLSLPRFCMLSYYYIARFQGFLDGVDGATPLDGSLKFFVFFDRDR